MSKDLTPRELWDLKKLYDSWGVSLMEIGNDIRIVETDETGKEIERALHGEDELAVRAKYPVFSFLYNEFHSLYRACEQFRTRDEMFDGFERTLAAIVEDNFDGKKDPLYWWYNGSLVLHFYYSRENDEQLFEWCLKQIKIAESRLQKMEKWMADNDLSVDSMAKEMTRYESKSVEELKSMPLLELIDMYVGTRSGGAEKYEPDEGVAWYYGI